MYTLLIEDTVKVPVKIEINNAGTNKLFNFDLICDRLSQEELSQIFEEGDVTVLNLMKRLTKGWENQTLVVDGDKKPVEFNVNSFECLLKLSGIHMIMWNSYLKEVGAKTKN